MPILAWFRDGVEDPEALAGAHIESADVAFDVGLALRDSAFQVRRADDHDIFGDDGRGVEADAAGDQIHLLVVILLEIDHAVDAEARDRDAGFGIERD